MARKGCYTKKAKLGPGVQQPQTGATAASASHHDDSQIPPATDYDSTIKPARLSVREAMERPNGRRIMLRFNNTKQAIRDKAGLLSGVLGLLGSVYEKFPICEKSWRKITTKDKVYNECVKERIEEIEQVDESSRVLSENDSIAQVFGKERPDRVRGVGSGPTPSQLFGLNSHATVNGVQVEETQRKLLELQAELESKKLKRKAMEDEAAADKKKWQAMESAQTYLYQRQVEELPPEIATGLSSVD
ncbi:hypothetical protein Ahy_B07g086228 [Arachis hypogaea]|uniref:Uncharacterized protein n=1 Tax=Arachis hypogaea TaxID=3818 RepID=A0A444Y9I4_ARAHY|nr:hypothetical protein Ahy_B07g086228 [Arachis hypogaea]